MSLEYFGCKRTKILAGLVTTLILGSDNQWEDGGQSVVHIAILLIVSKYRVGTNIYFAISCLTTPPL